MITLTAIAAFLSPYLIEAGKKVATKTVETLFDSRKELAESFKGLFKEEFISLGLNEDSTIEEINRQLEAKPEVKEAIEKKIVENRTLLDELVNAAKLSNLPELRGININAEKIAQININPQHVEQNITNF